MINTMAAGDKKNTLVVLGLQDSQKPAGGFGYA